MYEYKIYLTHVCQAFKFISQVPTLPGRLTRLVPNLELRRAAIINGTKPPNTFELGPPHFLALTLVLVANELNEPQPRGSSQRVDGRDRRDGRVRGYGTLPATSANVDGDGGEKC